MGPEITRLIELLGRLPGIGPRSARRVALHLMKKRETLLGPLAAAMTEAAARVTTCKTCGNLDTTQPCGLCAAPNRDDSLLCVVQEVGDLWAMERSGVFRGRYHVLGGALSALEGIGPEELNVAGLLARVTPGGPVREVILALNATVDGQTTAHYLADRLASAGLRVTGLAHGVPVGGELDHLDDGTLSAALISRRAV
jgi:recombination protein RecR